MNDATQRDGTEDAAWPELHRERRTVLVVDVVESVRLMQRDEDGVIARWRRFVAEVVAQVLPQLQGRLVKSLGDGMLLEFAQPQRAVQAAFELNRRIAGLNVGARPDAQLSLRQGCHVADVVIDELDIYGQGVNLAARLASLGGPGEIVVSDNLRDALFSDVDADIEDLGLCHLKHIDRPIRAFRLAHVRKSAIERPTAWGAQAQDLRAVVAIVPFAAVSLDGGHETRAIGDLIADGVIARLSGNANLRLISRMSSDAFRGRADDAKDVATPLGADYVLSGSFLSHDQQLVVMAQIAATHSGDVIWAERVNEALSDLLSAQSSVVGRLADAICREVQTAEVRVCESQPAPNLRSYSLQLAGVSMMHRSGAGEFERAKLLLDHVVERHSRLAAPRAWIAMWHVLRVTRGIVQNPSDEASAALDQTRRALDADPNCSLAMAMQGFVRCHLVHDLDGALSTLDQTLALNPSEGWAWLFRCVVLGFFGRGPEALESGQQALTLSPLDPLRHYHEALVASAALSAERYELAADLAGRSLRANRFHAPTWRFLAIAQSLRDQTEAARTAVIQLRLLDPQLTVASYLDRAPAGANELRRRYADALHRAGLPMS